MTRPPFVLDRVMGLGWMRRPWLRRAVLAALLLLLGLLALFPRHYLAVVKLAPPESSAQGLSAVLGGLGGTYSSLLTSQPAEIDLAVARSYDVMRDVARQLGAVNGDTPPDEAAQAVRRLDRDLDVRALRGGMLQIEMRDTDPRRAMSAVDAFATSLRRRLSTLSRQQITFKRGILNQRLAEASEGIQRAQQELTDFRRTNRLPAPQEQLSQSVLTLNTLEGTVQAKRAALATERRFSGPENYAVKRLEAEIAVAQRQLDVERSRQENAATGSTASLVEINTRYADLLRNLTFAQSLYQSYIRYLEGSAVEELTAQYNLEKLESTHLDPYRQYNLIPLGLFILVLGFAIAAELYIVAPPAGALVTSVTESDPRRI
ncbi:hypothetical protein K7957_11135 [Sphingomonas yunnanensis]|uniref:hypothetical protein n=1 Tax=Sphingomonas yunnanensis TaxID=310400 RepID=UPI001CA77ECF|nr:hypothetical protein [Sphingomonas yunnanensis]MBY9063484.1 hypothetical protein [Sphingomonas yunnanensis]